MQSSSCLNFIGACWALNDCCQMLTDVFLKGSIGRSRGLVLVKVGRFRDL